MEGNRRVSWIEYNGKKILLEDYSGLKGDALLEVLYASEEVFKTLDSPTLVLMDFTHAYGNTRFMKELKRLGKKYDPFVEKASNVGVTGLGMVLAKSYLAATGQSYKTAYFDNLEDAKDFLVK